MRSIYLDWNSTAPLLPEAAAAIAAAYAEGYANPASQHSEGRRAHRALENAREEIARFLGANLAGRHADRLIFTSGGTEANNLALRLVASGTTAAEPSGTANRSRRLAISAIEHPSIVGVAEQLSRQGCHVEKLGVLRDGTLDLGHLDAALSAASPGRPDLVSVMVANNETGVLQPLAEVVARCKQSGVPVHTDASQAAGKMRLSFRELGVAAMTVAPHKFGGPRGIGALLLRHDVEVAPILFGGAQQLGRRPGTESVALALGFLAALKTWDSRRDEWRRHMEQLRDRFESKIKAINPSVTINGTASRLPSTSNIAFVGRDRQALFMAMDLAGICCSTGSACASGSSEPSPTLQAMQLPGDVVGSSLRFSLGPSTTEDELDEAVRRIEKILAN